MIITIIFIFGDRGYDLSMLFIESCIDYLKPYSPPGFVFDNLYPSKEKRVSDSVFMYLNSIHPSI